MFSQDAKFAQLGLVYRFGKAEKRIITEKKPEPKPKPVPVQAPKPVVAAPVPAVVVPKAPLDGDNDGVLDSIDKCLRTSPGALVDARGCAYLEGSLRGALFELNKATLTATAEARLLEVVMILKKYPTQPFQISAHTDNIGTPEQNMQLSRARAISVARFVRDRGIAGSRFRIKAYGETKPISSNDTEEGRAENRRVEIVMLK